MKSSKLTNGKTELAPIPKLLKNNVLKLAVIYIIWSLIYGMERIGFSRLTSGSDDVLNEILNEAVASKYHL